MSWWTRPWLPNDPLGLVEHRLGVDRPRDAVEHAAVGRAEIRGNVPALLLVVDDAEGRDLLEGADEMLVEVRADFRVRQGVHPERLGVVSGELRVLKISRDVEDEDELLLLLRLVGRIGGRAGPYDRRLVALLAAFLAGRGIIPPQG